MAGHIANSGALTLASNAAPNVTDISLSGSVADAVSQVMGQGHDTHQAGSQDSVITVSGEVAQTNTTEFGTNFARGTTGAVEYHPFGDTATYIEITSTNGTVLSLDMSGAMNGIVAYTLTIGLDDFTLGAAV